MEGDKLYSIKWYRNGHEFYRYIPSDNPSTTIFNGNGINVDKSQSSEEEILLRSVDLDTTGLYMVCTQDGGSVIKEIVKKKPYSL